MREIGNQASLRCALTGVNKETRMIEILRNEMSERDKYKSYLILSLMGIYVLVTIMYFTLIDVHNLDIKYRKSQEDLVYTTTQMLEYKMLLAENEELLRIQSDLQKVLP